MDEKSYLLGYADAKRDILLSLAEGARNFDSKHDSSMIIAFDSVADIVDSVIPTETAMTPEEVEEAAAKDWPNTDSKPGEFMHGVNVWNTGFLRFARLLASAEDLHWWISDMRLKYLNIRVDTRNNRFIVTTKENGEVERVEPSHIATLILKNMKAWGRNR